MNACDACGRVEDSAHPSGICDDCSPEIGRDIQEYVLFQSLIDIYDDIEASTKPSSFCECGSKAPMGPVHSVWCMLWRQSDHESNK